jgi:hypothetical protein
MKKYMSPNIIQVDIMSISKMPTQTAHTRVSERLNVICEINIEVLSLGKNQANEPHCAELVRLWFQL